MTFQLGSPTSTTSTITTSSPDTSADTSTLSSQPPSPPVNILDVSAASDVSGSGITGDPLVNGNSIQIPMAASSPLLDTSSGQQVRDSVACLSLPWLRGTKVETPFY